MDLLELDAESVSEMKAFYQEELAKAIRRIDHINKVLSQLGAPGVKIELRLSDDRTLKPRSKSSVPKRKYKKKRGPKSKWDKVILKTLNQAGRPLSYDELTDYLMISEAREPSKRVNTKATVQNTVFRLRHEKKLRTFSLGARTKYIAPTEWFEGEEIKTEYRSKVSPVSRKEKKPLAKRGPGRPPKKRGPGRPPKTTTAKKPSKSSSASSSKKSITQPKVSTKNQKSKRAEETKTTRSKRTAAKTRNSNQANKKTGRAKKTAVKRKPSTKTSSSSKTERKFLIKKTVKK